MEKFESEDMNDIFADIENHQKQYIRDQCYIIFKKYGSFTDHDVAQITKETFGRPNLWMIDEFIEEGLIFWDMFNMPYGSKKIYRFRTAAEILRTKANAKS